MRALARRPTRGPDPLARPTAVLVALSAAASVALGACGSGSGGSPSLAGPWQAETITDGDATTVRTLAGSVWGGSATFVEELSIGVEEGDPAYMLGGVTALAAGDDRIYVLDDSVNVVRVYDSDGVHVDDIGGPGQGPGEFERPMSMVVDPTDSDDPGRAGGRVLVRDDGQNRITVFDLDGNLLDTWPTRSGFMTSTALVLGLDGRVYTPMIGERGSGPLETRWAFVPHERDGTEGEPRMEPALEFEPMMLPEARGDRSRIVGIVPFSPREHTVFSPAGVWIAGVSSEYRLEIRYPDGTTTVIERPIEPVPVDPDEADWHRKRSTASMRRIAPDWSWGGARIPGHKPFFEELFADYSDRLWVRRAGPGIRHEDCDEDPDPQVPASELRRCWEDSWIIDVFDLEGRYLGEAELPGGMTTLRRAYLRDDVMLAAAQDELGTIVVKRYRIVTPAD